MPVQSNSTKRLKLELYGVVQGVGFRPYVYQLAQQFSLLGFIRNDSSGLHIEIEGESFKIESFLDTLTKTPPPLARVDKIQIKEIPTQNTSQFEILQSSVEDAPIQKYVMPLADISLCDACKDELKDSTNRRYAYPFINCTNCGARHTIIKTLPYDREHTAMAAFKMCDECQSEYDDPMSRRFHAEAISCKKCGPQLYMQGRKDKDGECVKEFTQLIKRGNIGILKGMGGFHLICEAANEQSVQELRKYKNRPAKPLALMFKDINAVKQYCYVSDAEEELLLSKERPIVLLRKKQSTCVAHGVAPNIDILGVFLPYSALYEVLFEELEGPLVVTSANLSGEPIIQDEEEVLEKFSFLENSVLTHDREIVHHCDDSVVMDVAGEKITLRLSRGYGPKSLYDTSLKGKKILALGSHQKNTITLAFGSNIILSAHIGELDSLLGFDSFVKTIEYFKKLYNFEPETIVCDMHPEYESTKFAKEYVRNNPQVELIKVQHHYAHALACMAEHKINKEALAFCFDGTGYGEDGELQSIWGGEVLKVSTKGYKRHYHLQTFALLGGDKALKEPRRVALALLFNSYTLEELLKIQHPLINSFTKNELETFYHMSLKGINAPECSSVGRLFDAVFALCDCEHKISYEGESGLILERLAHENPTSLAYIYEINDGVIGYKQIIDEILCEKNSALIAAKFLNTLVNIIIEISKKESGLPVILSGGVFQNRTLLEKLINAFNENKIEYFIQNNTPINDGGISLGQAYYVLKQ